ncbi:MAG: hypothetical protein AAF721_11330 [Myxococcota bacterium]
MHLRLICGLVLGSLVLPGVGCNGDDDPGGGTSSGDGGGPMTMTLTTMGGLTSPPTTDDDGSGTTGDTTAAVDETGGSTTDGGIAECPGLCVELAPAGWQGPVATIDTDTEEEDPTCPEGYAVHAVEAFDDFEATDAICDCDCDEVTGALCDMLGTVVDHGASADCGGPELDSTNLANDVCVDLPFPAGSFTRLEPVEILATGACFPISATELPEPTFGTRVTACEPNVMRGFSCDEVENMGCVTSTPPPPLAQRMCIWREGEHDCPEDTAYIDDRILYDGFEDDRGCTECTCDSPVGVCDNASASLYTSTNCTTGLTAMMTGEGFCEPVEQATATARFVSGNPSTFCPASDVEATGEVVPSDAVTLCCTT